MKRLGHAIGVCVWILMVGAWGRGQVTTGTILGTVSDSTGAVVPGSTVAVRNSETGFTRTATTDATGHYRAPELPVGNYEVTAEANGFQSIVRKGIELTVGRQAVVDFALQVGAVSESITVSGEAPLIETTNATVANLVSEREMRELPLNGRSFTDLTAIQPGVVTDLGIASGVFQGGGRLVMNGARPQQSLYLLDGTDIVSPYSNVAPVSVMNQSLGVDTIREFTVLQNNYGAQFGRAMGGVVNAVTRSGTNTLHGSAFEFLRNDKFDAKNFFDDPNEKIPPFKRNQFGGTIGGPIVKDKTFFFFSYEGLRQVLGVTDLGSVLSDETRAGIVTGCPAGQRTCSKADRVIIEQVSVNPNIVPLINMMPRGNSLYKGNGLQDFLGSRKQPGRENYFMYRIDHHLGENDTIYGRMVMDRSSKELPDSQFLDVSKGIHTSTNDWGSYNFATVEWTHIMSASILNVARLGFARNNNNQCMCYEGAPRTSAEFYPSLPSQLQVIPGVPLSGPYTITTGFGTPGGHNGPGAVTFGADLDDPLSFIDNTFSYFDSVRISKGMHSLDIGVDIRRYQENELATVWGHGNVSWFDPVQNFLTGGVSPYCVTNTVTGNRCQGINSITTTGVTQPPDAYRGWRQTYGSFYVQDDIRLFSNFTLNAGLRWERVGGPVEVNKKAATLKNVLTDKDWTQLGSKPLFDPRDSLHGFAPRLGMAYSPDSKTSIRAGFGLFKEMPLEYTFQLAIFYPPYSDRLALRSIKQWPQPLAGANPAGASRQPQLIQPDFKYPYGYQWNFGIERQIGKTWVAKASYIGSRGVSLEAVIDQVQAPLSKDGAGQLFTASGTPTGNPFLDSTRTYASIGDSWYNALQLRVEKRMGYGLDFSASYTWSKNLGDVGIGTKGAEQPSTGGGGGGGFQIGNMWDYKHYDKGRLDQDAPQSLVINYSYQLPIGPGRSFGKNMGKTANAILGGWQVNGIITARSGLPSTISGGGYSVNSFCRSCTVRPNLKPGGNNNPVTGDIDHWFDETQFTTVTPGYFGNVGKNTLTGPSLTKVDFSVFKMFPLSESRNLQLRAEFFNIPNHPNFPAPSGSVFTTTGAVVTDVGRITQTTSPSRQVQLALKFEF
jgi:carboxypeptidase family protein/TonB-dependent receptor-like protein